MSEYENAIEIKGITKKYDGFTLDNVSFDVPKGSIMGFIGQNGAGKSTTIRSLLNIIPVDGGEIKILGLDHLKNEKEIKERIAVVFDELPFNDVFNAKDMSRIFEGIYPKWNRNMYVPENCISVLMQIFLDLHQKMWHHRLLKHSILLV